MVDLLIQLGANIEAKTRDGLTPLHCAARSGHDHVIERLLQTNTPRTLKTKVLFVYLLKYYAVTHTLNTYFFRMG